MKNLREKISKAWWELDTKTELARKTMPSPNQHKNLMGSKEKYLNAVIEVIEKEVEMK